MSSLPTIDSHAADLRAGRTSSAALAEGALERIQAPGGEGARAFTRVYDAQARAAARASDGLRAEGLARSPLDGLPVAIKALLDVAGETTLAAIGPN
jgi:aspartyl-tRNA(Asn)/glutamyl-tRNA(Gln) amidotransferase subunit A